MKKEYKIIALIYLVVALLTYTLTLRVDRLENQDYIENQNRTIVLKLK